MDIFLQNILYVLVFVSVTLLTIGISDFFKRGSYLLMLSQEDASRKFLNELFIKDITPREVLIFTATSGIIISVFVFIFTNNTLFSLGTGFAVLFLPTPVFIYLRKEWLGKFEEQLPLALDQISSSARAGLSLPQALEEVAKNGPANVSQEFGSIVQELKLGTELAKAINNSRKRLGSKAFNLVGTALIVNQEKGGNLPEALEIMSKSLKEIWRLEQKLTTATAEGRKAFWVISAIPIFVFFMVMLLQPDLAETLTGTFYGIVILIVSLILYGIGIWWLLRILRTDI